MKKLILILVALVSFQTARAQLATADQIPTIRQSKQQFNTLAIAFPKAVVSGDTIVLFLHNEQTITTTIADTCGTSYTQQLSFGSGGTSGWIWTGSAACSGANTVTVTITSGSNSGFKMAVSEWTNVTTTVDGTGTANNNVNSSGVLTFPNVTTSFYRDLVLDFASGFCNIGGAALNTTSTYSALTGSDFGDGNAVIYNLTGNPGTVTGPSMGCSSNSTSASEGVIALRSTTNLTVSTPAIPDAVSGTPYSFQMQATGGTGTNVWTTTAGTFPCGLSISSGGVISGTPTCGNTNTITFQVTDAGSHTATANLTINTGTSTNTPALLQSKVCGSSCIGGSSFAFGSNVASGSLILVQLESPEFVDAPFLTDTRGTVYSIVPGSSLEQPTGFTSPSINTWAVVYWGFTPSAGANTISFTGNVSGLEGIALEFSNIQKIFDTGVISLKNATSIGSPFTSAAITLPQSEMAVGLSIEGTNTATVSIGAPFSAGVDIGTGFAYRLNTGYQTGAASGSQTASWTISSNTRNNGLAILMGFRPTTAGAAPTGSVKHRGTII